MSSETTLAVLLRQHTLIVVEVEEGGLGAALGVLPGDRILEVQGWRVRASADIRRILDSLPRNGSLSVQVRRAGGYSILGPITLAEEPDDPPHVDSSARPEPLASRPRDLGRGDTKANPMQTLVGDDTPILLVTSESIAGYVVTEVKGLVSCVRPVPRRAVSAAAGLESAVASATEGLRQSAQAAGANAVIAVRVGNQGEDPMPAPAGAQPEALIMTGTAVVVVAAVNSLP
jgi:uncharacterized protein YbjQ (UPF0145 family)